MFLSRGPSALYLLIFCAAAAAAPPTAPPPFPNDPALQQLKEYFDQQLRDRDLKYEAELRKRDEKIAGLESQLQNRPLGPGTAPGPSGPSSDSTSARSITQTKRDLIAEIDSGSPSQPFFRAPPISFNPDIAVVVDFLGTFADDRRNKALNRMDVREAELDIRAAVDPRADAVVVLAFARDVENPLFPEMDFELEGVETGAEIEEAFLFLHDFGIPNLTAKVGRFHLRFGRQNLVHLHDLPTSDPSLVNQAFLAPEALSDSGVSFSYLIPNPWDAYLEAVVEIISGEGISSESPTLAGDLQIISPAINAHFLWNTDLGDHWNMELGASILHGRSGDGPGRHLNLYGADLTLIRTDPTGGFNNLLLQAEAMFGDVTLEDMSAPHSWGFYALAQQQLSKDWYVGIRGDWTENPLDATREVWAVSPYVSWYWSEFLRFRLEFQHKEDNGPTGGFGAGWGDENLLMFQVTWIFGAHPPHPYWSMK